jgi:hypothetical protein
MLQLLVWTPSSVSQMPPALPLRSMSFIFKSSMICSSGMRGGRKKSKRTQWGQPCP